MKLLDRFTGSMLGMAVGDALGMGTEFMRESDIPAFFGMTVDTYFSNPQMSYQPGEYTDDTEMAACIAESLLACGTVDLQDIAARFVEWKRSCRDIGILTSSVLERIRRGEDVRDAARYEWEAKSKTSAGNGGLMRTAPVSLFFYNDTEAMMKASRDICRITHYDPRCVLSCMAQNVLLWGLLHGQGPSEAYELMCDSLADSFNDEEFDEAVTLGRERPIRDMTLAVPGRSGYTYLCLMVAVSALMNYEDFRTPIVEIVNKGGDADTNACVAGALLGALYGEQGIPRPWLDELSGYSYISRLGRSLFDRTGEAE